MFLIRNAVQKDLKQILGLARYLDSYNLSADKYVLKKLLHDTGLSFRAKIKEKDRMKFLFVAEEIGSGKIIGCSLIIARHGTPLLPHLSFELKEEYKTSRFLSKRIEHQTLKLRADPKGFTEIGGLVVLPKYRELPEKIGKELSYARFLYMARNPKKFQRRMIVEYLPKLDPESGNKLWESVGRKFTKLSYRQADRLSAVNKEFILSLFPKEKVYGCFLSDTVVRNLGMPGAGAKKSLRMLEKIGFRFLNQIDPFDGGPHYGAAFSKISLVRNTAFLRYDGKMPVRKNENSLAMIMYEKRGTVRSLLGAYERRGKSVRLNSETAELLGVHHGEILALVSFNGGRP